MNNYLARQQAHDKNLSLSVERVIKQLCLDVMQVTLHEDYGFGSERLTNVAEGFLRRYKDYVQALLGGDEHDVWQERLDRALLDIVKDENKLMSFSQRYPEIKKHGYDKPLRKKK